jgi:sugar lactone lactonase YvrE
VAGLVLAKGDEASIMAAEHTPAAWLDASEGVIVCAVMKPTYLLFLSISSALLLACGGSQSSASGSDAQADGQGDAQAEAAGDAVSGPGCTMGGACPSGQSCLFKVGSCSAKGECLAPDSLGGQCNLIVTYCGCDGQTVGGLCGPDYAYGPTLGQSAPCGPPPTSMGKLTTLAEQAQSDPENLATDGTNVYFTETSLGRVMQISVNGGALVTLASGQKQPSGIAVAGSSVFWTNQASGTKSGSVVKAPVGGGALVTLASGQGAPDAIAVGETDVYWTDIGGNNAVMKVPIAGGKPSVLAKATNPWVIAVYGSEVYWTDGDDILSAASSGGTATTLATGQAFPFDLAVDATDLYWTNASGAGAVLKMPKAGGTPTTLVANSGMARLAVDAKSVYFTTPGASSNDGAVVSVPLLGGTTTTLVTGQSTPEAIVLSATSLFWVDTYLGAVMKLDPK